MSNIFQLKKKRYVGNSLVVQWLGLRASTAGGLGLIPDWGTKILQATWYSRKKKVCGNNSASSMYLKKTCHLLRKALKWENNWKEYFSKIGFSSRKRCSLTCQLHVKVAVCTNNSYRTCYFHCFFKTRFEGESLVRLNIRACICLLVYSVSLTRA